MPQPSASQSDKTASHWPLVICLGLVAAIAPLSIDMYLPSFPAIAEEFGASAAQIQLTLSGYMIGFTLGQLGYGPLSDRFGRKYVLLSGITIYIAMTVLCAVASDTETLTVFRFFQAIGGGAGTVLSRAIIRDRYDGVQMAKVMSLMLTIILFAPMVAPVIGGYVLVWFGWRAVFWTLVILVRWRLPWYCSASKRACRPNAEAGRGCVPCCGATPRFLPTARLLVTF